MHPKRIRWPLLAGTLAAVLAGCADTAYHSAQQWQLTQCRQLPDLAERQRCERSNARSYEEYQREADKARR